MKRLLEDILKTIGEVTIITLIGLVLYGMYNISKQDKINNHQNKVFNRMFSDMKESHHSPIMKELDKQYISYNYKKPSKTPRMVYDVKKDFKIVVDTKKNINRMYYGKETINGMYVELNGTPYLFVSYSKNKDKNGNYLPRFETLGHELWHMKELGGRFHK